MASRLRKRVKKMFQLVRLPRMSSALKARIQKGWDTTANIASRPR